MNLSNPEGSAAKKTESPHKEKCECYICKNNRAFDLSDDLINSLNCGKIAIFAGAGISTEGSNIIGSSLYGDLKREVSGCEPDIEFPDLVSRFCNRPNGRLRFVEKILERFSNVRSIPAMYRLATKFHYALAPLKIIDTIVTTNWDDYFERECWATPFVFPEDIAFWSIADRRVLKIHGTIENLGSIVASKEDYIQCQERLIKGLIGSKLKVILSEKTVVFCGYSLRDFDFQEIMRLVQTEMNGFHRQAYIVTLDSSDEARRRFEEYGLIPIYTDASFFLEELYKKHSESPCVASNSMYEAIAEILEITRSEHADLSSKISMFDHPQVIYSLFFQDGLKHALERIMLLRKSGEYTDYHTTRSKCAYYDDLKKKAVRLRKYDDAAYIEGYISELIYSITCKDEEDNIPPMYFLFKDKYFWNFEEFEAALLSDDIHQPSAKRADSIVGRYERTDGMVLDHAHTLFGL